MNWRAIGCGGLAAVAFVALGLFAISRAEAPAGCPDRLRYEPAGYETDGAPTDQPVLAGIDAALVYGGQASFGLAAWPVWIAPAEGPATSGTPLPERIVLDCGDGTFQAYRREAV